MSLFQKWKTLFYKEDYDYVEGLVDPAKFHKSCYFFLRMFRVVDNEPIPKWRIMTPIYVTFCGITAIIASLLSMKNSIQYLDVPLITESGTYVIIMCYKLMILLSTKINLPQYHNLLTAMRNDFQYICTAGSKYREKYFENQLVTFQASLVAALFIGFMAIGMIVCVNIALIFYMVIHDSNEDDAVRQLPFPFWLFDADLHKSPLYEILFTLCNMFIFSNVYISLFMTQTQILWVRQIACKADVIKWSIQDLLVDIHPAMTPEEADNFSRIIRCRMRHIIEMHNSMFQLLDDYAGVHKKYLIYEQTFTGPVVCLTAFCTAQSIDEGEIDLMMVLLGTSVVVLVFIPSFLCTFLAEKVQSIRDACWDAPFWKAGPVIRPYMILVMQRALRPLPIRAAGFKDVSLETFSNSMANAYSCFNMLRQSNFEV